MTVFGIDLGTTHTAIAVGDEDSVRILPLAQWTARAQLGSSPLLPSFIYFANASEGPCSLPWDESRAFAVGTYARERGSDAPNRVVGSAKSWLCHGGVDRRGPILPSLAAEDIERISPVEASWRILEHVVEACHHAKISITEHPVVITVPASFDAVARELTVEAALAAGIENLTLLEEPQAALYAWIAARGDAWRKELRVGDVVLVVDIGGGTTDFSAIEVRERDGNLALERIAVGDHILLGGDNMDLLLAHVAEQRLESVDEWQQLALRHICRHAKEQLLTDQGLDRIPIAVASRGAKLVGGTKRTELFRSDVESVIVEGFFPDVPRDAKPLARTKGGLRTAGLPYAADPGITRHLAAFLERAGVLPTCVLFNGGVMKSDLLRRRLFEIMQSWLAAAGKPAARELSSANYDLGVALGAAQFGLAKGGKGVRIRGGSAKTYYVGVERNVPAVPGREAPIDLVCIVPFGMEEGTSADLPGEPFHLVVGEAARFRFFCSSASKNEPAGFKRRNDDDVAEVSPIEVVLEGKGRTDAQEVPVRLNVALTEIGTLKLFAIPVTPAFEGERWELEFAVRQ